MSKMKKLRIELILDYLSGFIGNKSFDNGIVEKWNERKKGDSNSSLDRFRNFYRTASRWIFS